MGKDRPNNCQVKRRCPKLPCVLCAVILFLQNQNSIFKKTILNSSPSFPNIPFLPLPLQTASKFFNLTTFRTNPLKFSSLFTNMGQQGADFHSGTTNVHLHFSSSIFLIHFCTRQGGGTTQLTQFDQSCSNASTPLDSEHSILN